MENTRELINSMGKREKAYFYQLNEKNSDKDYFKIYQAIEKNPAIEFNKLLESMPRIKTRSRLSVELNYLFRHILRSLHIYRLNSKSPLYTLLKELQFVQILIQKDLKKMALKVLRSLKKKAYKFEEYSILIQAIGMEEGLIFNDFDSNLVEKIRKLSLERTECIRFIEELNEIKITVTHIIELQYKEGLFIEKNNPEIAVLYNPILYTPPSASLKTEELKTISKSVGFLLIGDYEKSRKEMLDRIELVKENQHLFSGYDRTRSINNFLFLCTLSKSVEDFNWMFNELLVCFEKIDIPEGSKFYLKYYLSLRMNCVTTNIEKLKLILSELKSEPGHLTATISETGQNELYQNIIWACILTKDFDYGLTQLNKWYAIIDTDLYYLISRVFRLIIFYEKKEYLLLTSDLKTITENLRKKKLINKVIRSFLKFLVIETKSEALSTANYQRFQKELTFLRNDRSTKKHFLEFDFLDWLNNLKASVN